MKHFKRLALILIACIVTVCAVAFSGCIELTNGDVYVTCVTESTTDTELILTFSFSDETRQEIRIPLAEKGEPGQNGTNGADGENGEDGKDGENGTDGKDGEDGKDVTITDIYNKYVEEYGEISYADFLKEYFSGIYEENNVGIGECLLSSLKVYTEFIELQEDSYSSSYNTSLYSGSAVIWSMDADKVNGYTYLVTNYHVIYSSKAVAVRNGGSKIARNITAYLYGSESTPAASGTGDNGYTKYNYGNYAISCEYVGGAVTSDIAVIRAKTKDVLAINENAKPVTLADGYHVGEKAVAIGNPESLGISVSEGIISVVDENVQLNIDGTKRTYRSLRIDTAIYHGNSGGGLFNSDGKLIGITNSGRETEENINYAIPLEIVRGTAENIMYYYKNGLASQKGNAYKITFGVTVSTQNQKYVYDAKLGYGYIVEDVVVQSVSTGSLAALGLGLLPGDVIKAVYVGDKRYEIVRSTDLSDVALDIRNQDIVRVEYVRDGELRKSTANNNSYAKFTDMRAM